MSVLIVLLSFAVAEIDAAAKSLFETVEKKVNNAGTLKVVFSGTIKGKNGTGKFSGTSIVSKGDKFTISMEAEFAGRKVEFATVSDGKNQSTTALGQSKTTATQAGLEKRIRSGLGRVGPSMIIFTINRGSDVKQNLFEASDFQIRKDDKVGEFDTRVLKYTMTRKTVMFNVTVWIDKRTNLPVKRVAERTGDNNATISETTTYTLNPKLGKDAFKVSDK